MYDVKLKGSISWGGNSDHICISYLAYYNDVSGSSCKLLANKKEPFRIAMYSSSILAPVQGKMIEFGDLYTHF